MQPSSWKQLPIVSPQKESEFDFVEVEIMGKRLTDSACCSPSLGQLALTTVVEIGEKLDSFTVDGS